MNVRILIVGLMSVALLVTTACDKKPAENAKGATGGKADAAGRCPHEIKQEKCPFCNPGLVESEGFCGEHGVAEALCVKCRPYLKAAFRAKGDWCKEHDAPESQCVDCHPELKDKVRPGEHGTQAPAGGKGTESAAGNCEHSIAKAKCPFCTPSIIESNGFCKEHDIAEALCVKCHPYLEAAFKAKDDWCKEHNTPESQCAECNPELKNKPKGKG
jgi:hypothetical protein